MIVPMRGDGGVVIVRIVIDGIVTWGYTYAAEEHSFHKTGDNNLPNDHALGMPGELNMDVHTWRIAVFNTSEAPREYEIQLTWFQDGMPIAFWPEDGPRTGEVGPNDGKVEDDHAILAVL
jgi:hypothetical protein